MHALIVVAHPKPNSLTHAVAARLAAGVRESREGTGTEKEAGKETENHTAEIADLAAEGFDPRFTAGDFAVHDRVAAPAADILAEQARLDRADALVLVYPVFWWSMPGLLKGWIDRVFANGWAYDEGAGIASRKKLGRLKIHLVALGGATLRTYARHGYFAAMRTQIDHGIFGYCGAQVVTNELFLPGESDSPATHLARAYELGRTLLSRKASSDTEAA